MHITKMHGLGNDFIIINESTVQGMNLSELAKNVCRRKLNVGADGLIVVCSSEKADICMRIFNADGSEAEMCGNGIRCFSKYVFENGIVSKTNMTVETLAGIIKPVLSVSNGCVSSVRVDMGEVVFAEKSIPVSGICNPQNFDLEISGKTINICAVLVGVPHAIVFVDEINMADVENFGPLIEQNKVFPQKTNVDFVRVIGRNKLEIKTWERGAGLTLACGTGSCAAAVAAHLRGFCDNIVEVQHEAGSLMIELESKKVYMSGPAIKVFDGELF